MKYVIKKILKKLIRIDSFWKILDKTIIPFAFYTHSARVKMLRSEKLNTMPNALKDIFAKKTVLHGVFTGMQYTELAAVGSALFPKFLGCYEKELEPLLEKICTIPYSEIVDIGCAEGYYAVGLAMNITTAKIYAFDNDPEAVKLCNEMAELNNVSDRVITGAFCNTKTLKNIPFTKKALILSDCEGYEKNLFTKDLIPHLSEHDLLIEVHDCIDINISTYLRELFSSTHKIEVIRSIDDIQKAHQYDYPELVGITLEQKFEILRERRQSIMEWFYITPK